MFKPLDGTVLPLAHSLLKDIPNCFHKIEVRALSRIYEIKYPIGFPEDSSDVAISLSIMGKVSIFLK